MRVNLGICEVCLLISFLTDRKKTQSIQKIQTDLRLWLLYEERSILFGVMNDCKYTWEKTARISCHNFETNGRPQFRCIEYYLTKTELGIRFQQPSLIRSVYFLILTVYLNCLDQFLLPIAVIPFIYQNKTKKKHVKNAHCEFYEQFSCRKRILLMQRL